MANKIKAKLVLQLREAGVSANAISSTHHVSKKSQKEVIDRARDLGITYSDVKGRDEAEVYSLLFPERHSRQSVYAQPDWERVHKELARVGVTLQLLHGEYADLCRERGEVSMGYDRFCKGYRAFTAASQLTSRVGHKAGRICEVDWSGPTMRMLDPASGAFIPVYLFVGTLPFSRYSYVEPTLDMRQDTWLRCHVHMFSFFGGSTPLITVDNLKTGVIKHPKEGEVVLNGAYEEMAAHYSAAISAARVAAPKDKPSVEGTVGNIATAIIAPLRDRTFTDIGSLKAAVRERLDEYNSAPFQKRGGGSRRQCFEEEERALLRPLPAVPYEVCSWVYDRKVQSNSHVCYKRNFYSVSHRHIGRSVDLRVTDTVLEVYLGGERVATHALFDAHMRNRYSTHAADMPDDRAYHDWDLPRIRRWALRVGPGCTEAVDRIFERVDFEEQGYNAALSVLRLAHRYGSERLEAACLMALDSGVPSPRYGHLSPILKTNQDKAVRGDDPDAGYVRGSDYYGRI